VVGIDTRSEPIEMTRKLALTADLLVDGGKTSAEESRKEIEKLKPNGYVGWEGADGESDPSSDRIVSLLARPPAKVGQP
jgi:hypothetical protein